MQSDSLHPIEAGAQARAELIAAGISRCLAGEPNAPVASGANEGAIPPGEEGQNGEAEGELSPSHETFEAAAEASSAGPEPGSQPIADPVHFTLVDRVAKARAKKKAEAKEKQAKQAEGEVAMAAVAAMHAVFP